MNHDTQHHSTSAARKGKHITFSERQQIERWLRDGISPSQIAKLLDRHRSLDESLPPRHLRGQIRLAYGS